MVPGSLGTVTARPPTASELAVFQRVLSNRLAHFGKNEQSATQLLSVGTLPRNAQLDSAEHAAYTEVARLLLNLTETITKG